MITNIGFRFMEQISKLMEQHGYFTSKADQLIGIVLHQFGHHKRYSRTIYLEHVLGSCNIAVYAGSNPIGEIEITEIGICGDIQDYKSDALQEVWEQHELDVYDLFVKHAKYGSELMNRWKW